MTAALWFWLPLACLLLACSAAHIVAMLRGARAFAQMPDPAGPPVTEGPMVSVLVPARNEAANIEACLASLLRQSYTNYEVIVIDDASTDDTAARAHAILTAATVSTRLLMTDGGKKAALTAGVAGARGEIILTTDADSAAGPDWIARMAAPFADAQVVMVAGPIRLFDHPALLARLQQAEAAGILALTASGFARGRPTLCNGANLAFRKAAFMAVGGYEEPGIRASGDDIRLMTKLRDTDAGRLLFCKSRDAIVQTYGVDGLRALWRQRIRWASKMRPIERGRPAWERLALAGSFLLWPTIAAAACWAPAVVPALAAAGAAQLWAEGRALRAGSQWAGVRLPFGLQAVLQGLAPVFWAAVVVAAQFTRRYEWKGRRVR